MKNEINYTTEQYEAIYNIAAQKCSIGSYAKAIELFKFLIVIDSNNYPKYTKALAGCLHHNGDLEDAIHFYLEAYSKSHDTNADCLLYISDCLMKLGQFKDVLETLEFFISLYSEEPNHGKLLAKVKMLHKAVKIKVQKMH